jgi:DNA-binding transcriptional LysR family regulator
MVLKQAAIAGLGIVALPGYVCRDDVRSGALRRALPAWLASNAMLTALIPYRRGLLPSVRAFVDHLAAELPKAVLVNPKAQCRSNHPRQGTRGRG